MHYIKRNTKFSILSFLILLIIFTLTNYIQFLPKTEINLSLLKILKKYITNTNEHFLQTSLIH